MRLLVKVLPDLIGVLGAAALLYGVAQIYPPAAWVVGGLAGVAIAVRQAWVEGRSKPP